MAVFTVQVPKRTLQVLLDFAKSRQWEVEEVQGIKYCVYCHEIPLYCTTENQKPEYQENHAPDCPLGCAIRFATQLLTDPKLS